MTNLDILMMDGCTKSEAEKHLKKGTVVFQDFEKHFDSYMDELDIDDNERAEFEAMVSKKKPVADWGIVEDGDKAYYIMYAL